ncbi:MAG: transcriptional regulator, LysR family [Bradyrhizobium sp.]|nr:transcriptional regulator, LysR family [Bradyrhizobium sp.]
MIELNLDFSDRAIDVFDEGCDVVMRTGAAADFRLLTRILGAYPHAIVGFPRYLARAGVPEESPSACLPATPLVDKRRVRGLADLSG